MKKSVVIGFLTIALVLLVGLYLIDREAESSRDVLTSPPNVPILTDCSDTGIKGVWDAVFKEGSNGITIIKNTTDPSYCTRYYAYKTIVSGETFVLGGFVDFGTEDMVNQVSASQGKFSQSLIDSVIANMTEGDVGSGVYMFVFPAINMRAESDSEPRSIGSAQEAFTEYNLKFVIDNSSAFEYDSFYKFYNFSHEEVVGSNSTIFSGVVYADNYTNSFSMAEIKTLSPDSCTSSWQQINESCDNDAFLRWYNDTNSCPSGTPPSDNGTEVHEDCDGNGIIGRESSIGDTNLNLELYIGGARVNFSEVYNTTENVELKDNGTTRILFSYSFSSPLDLYGMDIKKQPTSSSFGYLIVNGISRNKTVRVDRLNLSNMRVCVEDKLTSSISSITSTCTGSGESLLNCPGSGGGFDCSISGGKFVVSGLMHSAVREMSGGSPPPPTGCTENWNCTGWSACVNGNKTQICTDLNGCNTTVTKPSETQTCGGTTGCTENWNCTGWSPSECPENQTQTKICVDLNNCGTTAQRPSLTQDCTYEKSNFWLIVIIVVVALLIMIGIIVLIGFLMRRGRQADVDGPPPEIVSGPPPLSRPPPSPVLRRPPPRAMPIQQPAGTPRF